MGLQAACIHRREMRRASLHDNREKKRHTQHADNSATTRSVRIATVGMFLWLTFGSREDLSRSSERRPNQEKERKRVKVSRTDFSGEIFGSKPGVETHASKPEVRTGCTKKRPLS